MLMFLIATLYAAGYLGSLRAVISSIEADENEGANITFSAIGCIFWPWLMVHDVTYELASEPVE